MTKTQRDYWDEEHITSAIHPALNDEKPSGSILWMLEELEKRELELADLRGLEIGTGKGRNALSLAKNGVTMSAFDFSSIAIKEAKRRAAEQKLIVDWKIADATKKWLYDDASFDIGIDCYASSDLDSLSGRMAARDEWKRVLKPGSTLLIAAISEESPFHAQMITKNPGPESGSFVHPSGKFEKTFSEEELWEFYEDFEVLASKIGKGQATFSGKTYQTKNIWLLLGI